jgi:hypothetical protein
LAQHLVIIASSTTVKPFNSSGTAPNIMWFANANIGIFFKQIAFKQVTHSLQAQSPFSSVHTPAGLMITSGANSNKPMFGWSISLSSQSGSTTLLSFTEIHWQSGCFKLSRSRSSTLHWEASSDSAQAAQVTDESDCKDVCS